MRQVLHLLLRAAKYDTVPVSDAIAAFMEARKHPDLILLDLGLPGGGGLNLMQRLQSIPQLAVIPVVVISARERVAIEREVLDSGASAFFQKPIDQPQLVAKIKELIGEP